MKQTPILRWLQNRPRLIIDATLHVIHITPHARSDSTSWNSLSKHPDESWGCVHPHTGCNLLSVCLATVVNIRLHLRAHIGVCNVYIHVCIAIVHPCVCKHTVRLCSPMYRNQTVHRYHASWQKSNSSQVSRIITLYAHVSAEVPVPLTSGHFCAQISGTIKPLTVLNISGSINPLTLWPHILTPSQYMLVYLSHYLTLEIVVLTCQVQLTW